MLPCANQGSPEPQTVWYQILNHNATGLPSSSSLSSLPSSLSSGLSSMSSSVSSSIPSGLSSTSRSSSNFQSSFPDGNRIRIGADRSNDRIYQWNTNLVIRDAALEHSKLIQKSKRFQLKHCDHLMIIICFLSFRLGGRYLCVVSNPVGEDSVETDLLVRGTEFDSTDIFDAKPFYVDGQRTSTKQTLEFKPFGYSIIWADRLLIGITTHSKQCLAVFTKQSFTSTSMPFYSII